MYNENNCITLEKISENTPGALLVYKANESEEILFVSEELVKIFECDSVDDFMKFTVGSFSTIVYPEDIEEIERKINEQVALTHGYDYITYRIITKNGNIKQIEDWGRKVRDKELGDLFYVYLNERALREALTGESSENTEKTSSNDSVAEDTAKDRFDDLTGLLTIKAFRKLASEFIKEYLEDGARPHCIFFNIRNFRTYNESYGFEGGDRILRSVSRILLEVFPGCLISHLDKDHFAVIAPFENLTERINRMTTRVINLRRGAIIEIKAGVYEIKDTSLATSVICDCAKFAADSIKHEYGQTICFYDGNIDEKAKLQNYIIREFPKALENGEFKVYLQKVVDVNTGKTVSAEALTRWEDPKHGRISPLEYIYVLEENNLIHKLDTHVIKEVCKEIKRCEDNGGEAVPVSINLSGLDFELANVVRIIKDAVRENGLSPDRLFFELTESLVAVDMDKMQREAEKLRENGFNVWMDAFGTEYSSLKVLRDFPLDGIKVDVKNMKFDNNSRDKIIVEAVIGIAKRLGIPVLCKGVETREQLDFLKDIDCKLAQGYLFGRPEPIKE